MGLAVELFSEGEVVSFDTDRIYRNKVNSLKGKACDSFRRAVNQKAIAYVIEGDDYEPLYQEVFYPVAGVIPNAALSLIGDLADNNFGKEYRLVERDSGHVLRTAKLTYAWDDPVWEASPSSAEAERFWRAIVLRAAYDATRGELVSFNFGSKPTPKEAEEGRRYIYHKHSHFIEDCNLASLDAGHIREKVSEFLA